MIKLSRKINISSDRRKDIVHWIFVSILAVYTAFLLYIAWQINVAEDEIYTLNTTSHSLKGVIQQSYIFEGQPPGYFLVLSWWRKIHDGIFFARLFSIVSLLAASFFFYRSVLLLFGRNYAKSILLLFLLNPFSVWAALEIRTYSFLVLLSTVSVFLFIKYLFYRQKNSLYLLLIVALVGIYTQYFFCILIAAFSIVVLIRDGWMSFFRFCLYCTPVIALFLPNFWFIADQVSLHEVVSAKTTEFNYFSNIAYSPQNFLLATNYSSDVWTKRVIRIVFLIVWALAYALFFKSKNSSKDSDRKRINVNMLVLSLFMIAYFVAFSITDVSYNDKYMAIVFPLFMFTFIVFRNFTRPVPTIIYTIVILYYISITTAFYKNPVNTYDYQSAAQYIMKTERPNEPILFYRPVLAIPFKEYYRGTNQIIPIPRPVNFDSSYLINIKDTNELRSVFKKIGEKSRSLLFISDTTTFEGTLDMNRDMITDYIESHYNITLDSLFFGYGKERPFRIRRLEN